MNTRSTTTTTTLCVLSIIGVIVVGYLIVKKRRDHFNQQHPILNQIRENFAKLNPKYAQIPMKVGKSSYTEDKKSITMCIQDPETKRIYDMNTLMYVALHELAHMISKTVSEEEHNEEFRQNFAKLLNQASEIGIYNPNIPIPPTYCGIHKNN